MKLYGYRNGGTLRAVGLGHGFAVADIVAGHTLLWAKSAHVSIQSGALDSYIETLQRRPPFQRAQAKSAPATSH